MNIAVWLEKRQQAWAELESYCDRLELTGRYRLGGPTSISRFASLYRSACADLALADAYHLPPATIAYLHRLVGRAHNQLYRSHRLAPSTWVETVLSDAPRQIFADPCVRVATLLFFGLFSIAMLLGVSETRFVDFAPQMVGQEQLQQIEEMYAQPINGSLDHYVTMAGFYVMHNTGIGLKCFAFGVLIIPCLFQLAFNAITLGTIFGYMAREDSVGGDHFLEFVTAHGPFELTAIALAGAAGLRIGIGLFATGGRTRIDSLRHNATLAVPVMAASATLFFLAALTEGFISPSPLPYTLKAAWAIGSAGLISFYFVVLGFPRELPAPFAAAPQPSLDPFADEEGADDAT